MTSMRQLSFSGGEITPAVWGRADIAKHATGLKLCKNFFVMRHGGVANRAGTKFVGEVKDSTKAVRLIEFIFNADQTYVLEFGDQYMRVIRNDVHVKDLTKTITAITNANPAVVTSAAHGFSNGDEVYISGVVGMTEVNVRNFKVANVAANTFELQDMGGTNVNSTGYGTYSSGGTAERVYTITTPYLEADLFELYFAQSADIIYIVHPSYAPRQLARTGHASWTLTTVTFGPTIGTPTGGSSSSPGTTHYYVITAVDAETSEESLQSADIGSTSRTSTLSWTAVTGAGFYNIYYKTNGIYAWIGLAGSNSFTDNTLTADPLDTPPVARNPFSGANNYPSTVTFYQQRLFFGNTNNNPEGIWGSRSALRNNFNVSSPGQSDDAVTFSLAGTRVQSVRHIFSAAKLLVLTDSGEWVVDGNQAGIITPSDINPRQQTANGSSSLQPIFVEGSALYVQARGSVVRDLNYDFQTDGYRGNELSIFASHLFDNYTMVDWSYQQIPHSIVWVARSDGAVLGMTYVREHALFGWHQHDFGGDVSSLAVIPQGGEDVLYVVVERTINGRTVKYIESMQSRAIIDIVDNIFTDSTLSYDGRNTTATTLTLTTGAGWTHDDTLTLTASGSTFVSTDVGKAFWLNDANGNQTRLTVTGYTSGTVVTGTPHATVPVSLQGVAVTDWSKAVSTLAGLWHLEGENVSVFADGTVAANPNNDSYTVRTVTNGQITLDDPHSVVHIGLPVLAELQTLDLDRPDKIMTNKGEHVSQLHLQVEATRGIFAGLDSSAVTELKIRFDEPYGDPVALSTGVVSLNILSNWNKGGSVYIQQSDPLPVAILSIIPAGHISGGTK